MIYSGSKMVTLIEILKHAFFRNKKKKKDWGWGVGGGVEFAKYFVDRLENCALHLDLLKPEFLFRFS